MTQALVGELALWVAMVFALWGLVTSAAASSLARDDLAASGARAIHASGVMLMLALLALATSLVRRDFTLAYPAAFGGATATGREMIAALWAAPPGALLVLGVAIAAVATVAARSPAVAAASQLVLFGVLATLLAAESPFARLPFPAGDGRGLPPSLRDPASVLVWPLWALAAASTVAAFALAIESALSSGDRISLLRRAEGWARGAWVLLSAALLLALWWSYRLPSGEETWFARAVDAGALGAWIALALAAHGSAIERRWMLRVRARAFLLAVPLPLLLTSVLLAPEGSWQSLHELGHRVGGAAWVVLIAATVQVLAYALVRAHEGVIPIGSRTLPLRALGGRLAHVGIVLVLAGGVAGVARREHLLTLQPGEATAAVDVVGREWSIVYQGLSLRERYSALGELRWRELLLPVAIAPASPGPAERELLVPEVREHVDVLGRPTAPPWPRTAIRRDVIQDIIIEPDSIGNGEGARLRVTFVLLPGLLWLGGAVMLAGGVLSIVGERR